MSQDEHVVDSRDERHAAEKGRQYEPPALRVIGSVEEMTQGAGSTGSDGTEFFS